MVSKQTTQCVVIEAKPLLDKLEGESQQTSKSSIKVTTNLLSTGRNKYMGEPGVLVD